MLRRLSASDVVSSNAYEVRKAKFNSRQAEISKYKRSIRSNGAFTTYWRILTSFDDFYRVQRVRAWSFGKERVRKS